MSLAAEDRRYIRAVEAAWSKLHGRPAVVSPREFEAIDGWRRRGIPLSVVLEVLTAAGRRRSGKLPRALTALADTIEEAWAVVAAGRTAHGPSLPEPVRDDPTRAWKTALDRAPESTRLHALLAQLLTEADAGSEAVLLDAALDRSLPAAVSDDLRDVATAETRRELASYRDRMSDEEFQGLLARALVDRLRRALVLPRLALTL